MAQKRTLILDEDDLIMVVKKDVIEQVDENRGELTRTEFVNFLIHSQLKEINNSHNHVDEEEFHRVVEEIKELLRKFLDLFLTLEMAKQPQNGDLKEWLEKVQGLGNLDSTD